MKFLKFLIVVVSLSAFTSCKKQIVIQDEGNPVSKTAEHDPSMPSMPSISVNDTQLYAEAFSNKDIAMLTILHGGPEQDYRYIMNYKAFANQGYRVIFYDQRGTWSQIPIL